ncbi:MAG: NAD(P)/FAD-dependent oxidoreductase [Dehalococcoidales bacterium]|nr:NAD(P)/FAD-dependent oxidoreductase [Dehalococcoidales bacterium]
MTVKRYDVVVIGGGPVGSQVAYQLAKMGHSIAVLERKKSLAEPVCCTGIISQECASAFAISESVILRRVNSARIFSSSGQMLRLWRPEPQACIVDRPAFNAALASRAQSAGAEYVLDALVNDLEVGSHGVSIEIASQEEARLFEARAAVIATGFASKLIEKLGLGKINDFVMGTQAEVETIGVDEIEVYMGKQIAPDFFAWLVPTSPGRAWAGLLTRRAPGDYLRKFMSFLLDRGKIASGKTALSYGGIPVKPLAKSYGHRLIIAGTAAGQIKPTTGGGIYYGLLCADIAANNLHRALESGNLSAGNLARYETDWKRKLGQELRTGYRARKFYERLSDIQVDHIFDIMRMNGIVETLLKEDDLSFDWHGGAVSRLLRHQALSTAFKIMKLPFLPERKN